MRKTILTSLLLTSITLPTISLVCGACKANTTFYTVMLSAGEGTFGDTKEIILSNVKPNTPLREIAGYVEPTDELFDHWVCNDKIVDIEAPVMTDLFLVASYKPKPIPPSTHTIILLANGGYFPDKQTIIKLSIFGDDIILEDAVKNIIPEPPESTSHFYEWVDESGNQIDMNSFVTSDLVLKATYTQPTKKYNVSISGLDIEGINIDKKNAVPDEDLILTVSSDKPMNMGFVDNILINGVFLENGFTFVLDDYKNQTGIIKIDKEKITGDVIISLDTSSDFVPVNFETDSWQTIVHFSDQGLEKLCAAYKCAPEDFIGKTRNININGRKHEVIVVGVQQDKYKQDNDYKCANLTFQFKSLISDMTTGAALTMNVSNVPGSDTDFFTSRLAKALNGDDLIPWRTIYSHEVVAPVQQISVYKMIKQTDPLNLWTGSIKPTCRQVLSMSPDFEWVVAEGENPIFLPTFSNLFSEYALQHSEQTQNFWQEFIKEGQIDVESTNKQYKYYAQPGCIQDKLISSEQFDCLKLKDSIGNLSWWWLSSPRSRETTSFGTNTYRYMVDSNGHIPIGMRVTSYAAISPCFCL